MPKKVIGVELTQEDLTYFRDRLTKDLGVVDITVEVMGTPNQWWGVRAKCWRYTAGEGKLYQTQISYITRKGPHFVTVIGRHLTSLYHIVDREDAGLPALIGH